MLLPDYIVTNDETQDMNLRAILRTKAKPFSFPLTSEDKNIIATLKAVYIQGKGGVGLAAPQIGFSKQAIILDVPDNDDDLKKWRLDLTDSIPRTVWLNPGYKPVGQDMHTDYEACFSVKGIAAIVPRYKTISYDARLEDGTKVTGIANGFLARVIQHEVDHLHGRLFIDYVNEDQYITFEQYGAIRKARIEAVALRPCQ